MRQRVLREIEAVLARDTPMTGSKMLLDPNLAKQLERMRDYLDTCNPISNHQKAQILYDEAMACNPPPEHDDVISWLSSHNLPVDRITVK